jgi:hypothetical protein
MNRVYSKIWLIGLLIPMILGGLVFPIAAQGETGTGYEVIAEALVVKDNFVRARRQAVKLALEMALEQNLRELFGDDEFKRSQWEIKKMLKKPARFVKSYRFIEAYDDPVQLLSRVKLEVVLFQDAVHRALSRSGIISGMEGEKQAVILIDEISSSSSNDFRFWDRVSISEASLTRSFIEAGIPVVGRDTIRYAISEEMVMSAMKGSIPAAVSIGLKAGADIVIVGNATLALVGDQEVQGAQSVRAAISVKTVSSHRSMLVAAKSDFATVSGTGTGTGGLAGEVEAFRRAGGKLTEFLIPTIQRHWESGPEKKEPQPVPAQKAGSLPLPLGDL